MHDLNDVKAILDIFQAHGHYEVRMPHSGLLPARLAPHVTDCDRLQNYTGRHRGLLRRRHERGISRQDRLEGAWARSPHEALPLAGASRPS